MKKTVCKLALFALFILSLSACGYRDEEHERNVLNGMLVNEEYDKLEAALAKANKAYDQKKLDSNLWAGRFQSLADINADDIILTRFDAWVAQKDSGYAYLARGMYLLVKAWEARGSRLAAETSEAQFAAFRSLALRAREDLDIANEKLSACALCMGKLIRVNRALNRPMEESQPLLEAAVIYDPYMASPVLNYFDNVFPQWGGSFEQMDAFIDTMRPLVKDPAIIDRLESRKCWEYARHAEGLNDKAAAFEWYKKGVNAHPYDMLMKNLAEAYAERGEHQQAAEILERNLAANGEWDLYTTEALAQQYYALDQKDKGDKMMKRRDEMQRRYNTFE